VAFLVVGCIPSCLNWVFWGEISVLPPIMSRLPLITVFYRLSLFVLEGWGVREYVCGPKY
jgi:hypothetical protein